MEISYRVTYDGADYTKWDRTFRRILKRKLNKIGKKLSRSGPYSLKQYIKNSASKYSENSPFYKASKNNRSVFYNIGFLRNAPEYEVNITIREDYFGSLDVGFINDQVHSTGSSLKKIVGSIIKGGTWTPTPAQRRAYWAKVSKGNKKVKRNDINSSGTFTQPPRDFISGYNRDVDTSELFIKNITETINETHKKVHVKKKLS